jgi:hypothetical protein
MNGTIPALPHYVLTARFLIKQEIRLHGVVLGQARGQLSLYFTESRQWNILSQLNPVHTLTQYFFNVHFNIVSTLDEENRLRMLQNTVLVMIPCT